MKQRIAIAVASLAFAGLAHGGLQEGIAAYQKKDYATARTELAPLAARKEPAALYYLGQVERFQDVGGKRNAAGGIALIKDAAELGYPAAMTSMGQFLRYGSSRYLEKNQKAALEWLEQASGAGDSKGKQDLADCLATCEDVPRDFPRAFALMEQLVAGGSAPAMFKLGQVYRDRMWGLAAPDSQRARELFEAAAGNGHVLAMLYLGNLLVAQVQPAQPEAAFGWLRKAADKGNNEARYKAGLMLLKGEGTPADDAAARAMFEAMPNNSDDAVAPLALLRYEGRAGFTAGAPGAIEFVRSRYSAADNQNLGDTELLTRLALGAFDKSMYARPDLTFRIFAALAGQGDPTAQYAVGIMTLHGTGTPADAAKGSLQLARLVQANKNSPAAIWASYLLSEQAYRHGDYRKAARLLPDIFDRKLLTAFLQGDGKRPWAVPGDLIALSADAADVKLSWTVALALRQGGRGPVGWAVLSKILDESILNAGKPDTAGPAAPEAARWAALLDRSGRANPELLALLAGIKAEYCAGKECRTALADLQKARRRGSLLARFVLANLYFGSEDSSAKFRTALGLVQDGTAADRMLKEMRDMGVTRMAREDLK